MSIIHDALKKAQKNINRDLKVEAGIQVKPSEYKPQIKPKPFLIYILVVTLGLFIGNIFFTRSKRLPEVYTKPLSFSKKSVINVNKNQGTLAKSKETPLLKTNPPIAEEAKKETQGELVLNGVFFSENEGYALINNRIVKEGDVVDGATVKRISLGGVELETGGKKVKLSTPSM